MAHKYLKGSAIEEDINLLREIEKEFRELQKFPKGRRHIEKRSLRTGELID